MYTNLDMRPFLHVLDTYKPDGNKNISECPLQLDSKAVIHILHFGQLVNVQITSLKVEPFQLSGGGWLTPYLMKMGSFDNH